MVNKAGIMEEMLEETLNMEEDEELEEEADAEVDKVLFDITDGKLGAAGTVKTDLPVSMLVHSGLFVYSYDFSGVARQSGRRGGEESGAVSEAAKRTFKRLVPPNLIFISLQCFVSVRLYI